MLGYHLSLTVGSQCVCHPCVVPCFDIHDVKLEQQQLSHSFHLILSQR